MSFLAMPRRLLLACGLLAGMLLAAAPVRADVAECFADQSTRRIAACSEVIDTPGLDAHSRSLAFAMRALAYSLREEYDIAIRDYDEALRLNPDFPVALNNRAWAYYKKGEGRRGLPDVERSLALDPLSPHAWDTRAHIKQMMGDKRQALQDYERAMRLGDRRLIKLYQCGLQNQRLYNGRVDGIKTEELREAMVQCVSTPGCDPLPPDEECRDATS